MALKLPIPVYMGSLYHMLIRPRRLDGTDMVEYNLAFLNHNDLSNSFFCLDKDDPTVGFPFDASTTFGPTYPPHIPGAAVQVHSTEISSSRTANDDVHLRLLLGSHLARHLRHEMERQKGYTATVGIATNKLLSKLVGNVHKPKNQTTLLPPYIATETEESNATTFMDAHDIGKVPGIGFKLSQKIRARILGRTPAFHDGLVYGGTKESVTVRDVRTFPGMGPVMLEETLSGPGSQKGIGGIIWGLINGVDETEVGKAKKVPSQISIEDSYIRLDTFEQVKKELLMLAASLIRRMHADLTEEDDDDLYLPEAGRSHRRWLAHPRTLRLSTRPRPPLTADGSRTRSFSRISRSAPIPGFVFNLNENDESLAQKLVQEALIPAFRKLHPEKSGWNLSLVNVAVTNMAETAAETKDSEGRDIERMLKRQDDVLKDWKVINEAPVSEDGSTVNDLGSETPEAQAAESGGSPYQDLWQSDDSADDLTHTCERCGSMMPLFAATAHERYHSIAE